MPTYVDECTRCGKFDEQQSISTPVLSRCPTRGSEVQRPIAGGTSVTMKGRGVSANHCERDALMRAGDSSR